MQMNKRVWDWRSYIIEYGPDNSTYKLILLTLSCFMDSAGGSCFPSVKKLAKCTSLGRTSVIKYLDKADKDGWIKKSIHGYSGQGWKRNEYTADIPKKVVQELNYDEKGGSPDEKGGSPDEEGGSGAEHYLSNTSSNNSPDSSVAAIANDVPNATDEETWKAATRLANKLLEAICEWDDTHKYTKNPPSLKDWVKQIDLAIRKDGRTEKQLSDFISFLFFSKNRVAEFWAPNIQSGKKLRYKFDQVKNQLKKDKSYEQHRNKRNIEQFVDSLYT